MFIFIQRMILEAFTIFSVYFLIVYSFGFTLIYITSSLNNPFPILLFPSLTSVIILYLRQVFQKQFRQIYKRFAISSASGLFLRFVLSFSLSIYLLFVLIPEFRRYFVKFDHFEADMAILLAKYIIAVVIGIIFVTFLLFLIKKDSVLKEPKTKRGYSIFFSLIGMLIISAIGSRYSNISGGWYGISESVLEKIGNFCFGSIPLFQFRLLFFGSDL